MNWDWSESFVVKDAINIIRKASNGEPFVSSFQPEILNDLVHVMFDCPEKPDHINPRVEEPQRPYDSICLTSGGADSTILWYWARHPQALYIDIGQPYANKEIYALKSLDINFHYLDLRGTHLGKYSWKHIIPGRNFLFLCIAAEMIKNHGNIWFAMLAGEGVDSGKGDKSYAFVNQFQEWYHAVSGRYVYVQDGTMHTKVGWLQWFGKNHDVDIIRKNTITCFSAKERQCGECQACLRKYLSFISIGIDTAQDYVAHPMFGAQEYVLKYKRVLNEALNKQDFSHYSSRRCDEDLAAIRKAEELMLAGKTE